MSTNDSTHNCGATPHLNAERLHGHVSREGKGREEEGNGGRVSIHEVTHQSTARPVENPHSDTQQRGSWMALTGKGWAA